jgi:predicted Rossmann-fold nucleotide-binding protein
MKRVPFVLFGEDFWCGIINWETLADAGTISAEDLDLFKFVETAEDAIAILDNWEGKVDKRSALPDR